jgi:spore coat polysaccharide biosynthesis predicted glycosyltransferase SpsG
MFALCIEASHAKGMGHLFRMLNFAEYLKTHHQNFIFLINDNPKTKSILEKLAIRFDVIDLNDTSSGWESNIIEQYRILYWVNDRLETDKNHAINVKHNDCKLITFDDLGSGAQYSDLNVCGLFFNRNDLKGKKILQGIEYLILNKEIDQYKKIRTKADKILVTLGGSDTYGVTIKVLKLLKTFNIKATIHIGPSFEHLEKLREEINENYKIIQDVPSLIAEFAHYDLAISGGGITPFEANASGLPCLIIANELFEIPNGEFLENMGSSKFLGYYQNIHEKTFDCTMQNINIESMSRCGLDQISTNAIENIVKEINNL